MKLGNILMYIQMILYLFGGGCYLLSKDYRLGLTSILYGAAIYTLFLL